MLAAAETFALANRFEYPATVRLAVSRQHGNKPGQVTCAGVEIPGRIVPRSNTGDFFRTNPPWPSAIPHIGTQEPAWGKFLPGPGGVRHPNWIQNMFAFVISETEHRQHTSSTTRPANARGQRLSTGLVSEDSQAPFVESRQSSPPARAGPSSRYPPTGDSRIIPDR